MEFRESMALLGGRSHTKGRQRVRATRISKLAATTALSVLLTIAISSTATASKSVIAHIESGGALAVNNSGAGSGADAGDLYLANVDRNGQYIQQVNQFGHFIRKWGWDVVYDGPDDSGVNEEQSVTVGAAVTHGTYQLKLTTATTPSLFDAGSQGSNVLKNVEVESGRFRVGDLIEAENGNIPAGTTITSYDESANTLVLSANLTGPIGGGPNSGVFSYEMTHLISYDAPATGPAGLQEAIEQLPVIGPGNVTVTGGPAPPGTPYDITFTGGPSAHDDVLPMQAVNQTLTGGVVGVNTVKNGGGFEICEVSNPSDICKGAVEPAPPGPNAGAAGSIGPIFVSNARLGIDPYGNVLSNSYARINVYGSDGVFQAAFGLGVAGGSGPETCTTTCVAGSFGTGPDGEAYTGTFALDPSTGNLLVNSNRRVDVFSVTHDGSGTVTAIGFLYAFGWNVVASGPDDTGGVETCRPAAGDVCQAGTGGTGIGELNNINDLAVNSQGVVYINEGGQVGANIQTFTPNGSHTAYVAAAFDPTDLPPPTAFPGYMTIGPGDHVFIVKKFAAGATPTCPNGSPSFEENRILEFDAVGTTPPLDTHGACAQLLTANLDASGQIAVNSGNGAIYMSANVPSDPNNPNFTANKGTWVLSDNASPDVALGSITPTTKGATDIGHDQPRRADSGLSEFANHEVPLRIQT